MAKSAPRPAPYPQYDQPEFDLASMPPCPWDGIDEPEPDVPEWYAPPADHEWLDGTTVPDDGYAAWVPEKQVRRQKPPRSADDPPPVNWSPKEIAARWGRSADFVRDHFARIQGILPFDRPAIRGKRRYLSIMVPNALLLREEARMRRGQ